MTSPKMSTSTGNFLRMLKNLEDDIRSELTQCGMCLKSAELPNSRKALIVEPQADGKPPREICKLVAGKKLDYRVTIEAEAGKDANEEAQIVYSGLQMILDLAKDFRKLFYAIFEDRCHEEKLLTEIDKIDLGAGKLFRIYAKEEMARRKGDLTKSLSPEDLFEHLEIAISELPPEIAEGLKRAADKAATEMLMNLETKNAAKYNDGPVAAVEGNDTVN